MPIDVVYDQLVFRIDIEEYASEDFSIDSLVAHAL
jgi:hypothetical protein